MKSDGLIPRPVFSQNLSHCLAPTRNKCVHALSAPRLDLLTQPTSHCANHIVIRGQVTMNIKSGLVPCIKFLGTEISSNDFSQLPAHKITYLGTQFRQHTEINVPSDN
jgi:hypothetical protein